MKFKRCWIPYSLLAAGSLILAPTSLGPPMPVLGKAALAVREAPSEQVFHGLLSGEPTFLIVHGCEVFRIHRVPEAEVEWTSVLEPEFYPFFTACVRQSLTFKAGAVVAILGRQAIGAGGCCASGGTYRSVDGRVWKKL